MAQEKVDARVRAFEVLKQQLDGVKAAALGRPLRVPKGMWKRGGGLAGKTTSDLTHYQSAYENFTLGRNRALENGVLTTKESESSWAVLGYYSTITVLDMLGDRIDKSLVSHVESPEVIELPPGHIRIIDEDGDEGTLSPDTLRDLERQGYSVVDGRLLSPRIVSLKVVAKSESKQPVSVPARPSQSEAPMTMAPASQAPIWTIEFEPDWIEDEEGQEYRVDRITAACVERIGALFLSGKVPSKVDRYEEHDMWAEALAAASSGHEQGQIEDALWTWAVAAARSGWRIENGAFVRKAS